MDIKREIKFRAWDKLDKRWVSDVYGDDPFEIYLCGNFLGLSGCNSWVGSERYSLLQFTGLKDKNGKEIYEGDIINQDHKYGWKNHVMELMFSTASDDMGLDMYGYPDVDNDCEVIGNIYENPELLEV